MKSCFCNRLYHVDKPAAMWEYAFSGSICRIREFKTADGSRYCLTAFSLTDYKHLHFPHDEYKHLINKLQALLSTQSISQPANNSDGIFALRIKQFDRDFKIIFGGKCLTVGSTTAFGLVNTSPFDNARVFSADKKHFPCEPKWGICTCAMCPVFKRLIDFEVAAQLQFVSSCPENVFLLQD